MWVFSTLYYRNFPADFAEILIKGIGLQSFALPTNLVNTINLNCKLIKSFLFQIKINMIMIIMQPVDQITEMRYKIQVPLC